MTLILSQILFIESVFPRIQSEQCHNAPYFMAGPVSGQDEVNPGF